MVFPPKNQFLFSLIFNVPFFTLEENLRLTSVATTLNSSVPKDVNVKVKSTPIFGGTSNRIRNSEDNKKTIYIEANDK